MKLNEYPFTFEELQKIEKSITQADNGELIEEHLVWEALHTKHRQYA